MPTEETSVSARAAALQAGTERDPFAVLGPHATAAGAVVRAFRPGAAAIELTDPDGRRVAAMQRVGSSDLFECALARQPEDYRFRVQNGQGDVWLEDDPYRFASPLGELDLHLIGEGAHQRIYEKLGAHPMTLAGVAGVQFAVWAPNAGRVSVVGDFNDWDGRRHAMRFHPSVGIWDIFIPGARVGSAYKFELLDAGGRLLPLKSDPFAFYCEQPPGNASLVYASGYEWQDGDWSAAAAARLALDRPISIYEVHLGSWRRHTEDGGRPLSYPELADQLVEYAVGMGFTHIELLPVSEHPFGGSWGYQPVGLYAPTSRFGAPDDLRCLIDRAHRAGLGVIVDWVGAHFPRDPHGLGRFDGTALYEHEDPRRGTHADWDTLVYNYGRVEVANYLIANALFWVQEFHVDALRLDAVASMLYLDYSREAGDWLPNEHGGNENLEAIRFLRRLNELIHAAGGVTIAEESTAWPAVSRPTYAGGLGFSYKWNMGWMNDTLTYVREDPIHRKFHHDRMTFSMVYAFNENFILPLSHDEVVHGKGSILGRMPGDDWQRFANLRAYYGYMFAHPGKKLLFMGDELAQAREWQHDHSIDWHLTGDPRHAGVQQLVRDINAVYRAHRPLYEVDFEPAGFRWLDCDDRDNSVFSWVRFDRDGDYVLAISNFTPVVRHDYRVGVPLAVEHEEILNTDRTVYGGSGVAPPGPVAARPGDFNWWPASLSVTLPPLATVYLRPVRP